MLKIFTSYFGNIKNVKNPVSISGKAPDWYKGPQFKKLAPKYSFFKDYKDGKIGVEGYTNQFNDLVLSKLNLDKIIEELQSLYPEEKEITILCYEKPTDFCHRHLVADWLKKAGYKVTEWEKE